MYVIVITNLFQKIVNKLKKEKSYNCTRAFRNLQDMTFCFTWALLHRSGCYLSPSKAAPLVILTYVLKTLTVKLYYWAV